MIQGIQNVSFTGFTSAAGKSVKKLEETFVAASSNLTGTVNATRAERMQRDARKFTDKDTLLGRVASLAVSKKTVPAEDIAKATARVQAQKEAKIANAAKNQAEMAKAIGEFNFFG